jgi:competence protein ComEA
MRKTLLTSLILPLIASLSFTVNAAPAATASPAPMAQTVMVDSHMPSQAAKLNLNQADAPTLQMHLSGIGKAKAEAIVAYREANGPFASVDELLEIKGIGSALLDRNRDRLIVE